MVRERLAQPQQPRVYTGRGHDVKCYLALAKVCDLGYRLVTSYLPRAPAMREGEEGEKPPSTFAQALCSITSLRPDPCRRSWACRSWLDGGRTAAEPLLIFGVLPDRQNHAGVEDGRVGT